MRLTLAVLTMLISALALANDKLVTDGTSGNVRLIDNAGNNWRAQMAYTTNGAGEIFTLGMVASSDNIIGINTSGNRTLIDSLGRWWSAEVLYTTDGAGNVIPIPTGGASGTVTEVNANVPVVSTGGATPTISIPKATSSVDGYLFHIDWSTFNAKQSALTFSSPLVNSTGTVSCNVASGSQAGCLSSSDWSTFNGKQASGSYITALTGDVVATGPGSVSATIQAGAVTNSKIANSTINLTTKVTGLLPNANLASVQYDQEKWVAIALGSDSGDGSFQRPWQTLGHACSSISGATLIHMTGTTQDQSSGTITCPFNVAIVSDSPNMIIQQPVVISAVGGINTFVSLVNLTIQNTLTWVDSEAGGMELTLVNTQVSGLTTFKNTGAGAGISAIFVYLGALVGLDNHSGQVSLQGAGMFGPLTYEDSGPAYLIVNGGDLAGAVSLNGGVTAWFTGTLADAGYSISGTTTASGTPSITADSGSIPPSASVTGAYTLSLTGQSSYTSYVPAVASAWSTVPSTVKAALDAGAFVSQSAVGSQPACTSGLRGLQWLVQSTVGVADLFQVCQQTVSGFAWVTH